MQPHSALSGFAPRAAAARHSSWGFQLWQGLGRHHKPQIKIQIILNPVQLQMPTVGALWRKGRAHHQPQHRGFMANTNSWSTTPWTAQAVQDPRVRRRNSHGTASQGSELCTAAPLACEVTAVTPNLSQRLQTQLCPCVHLPSLLQGSASLGGHPQRSKTTQGKSISDQAPQTPVTLSGVSGMCLPQSSIFPGPKLPPAVNPPTSVEFLQVSGTITES